MGKSNKKEWTVMFYFASDNPLAPGIVSQLKAIKYAGFHPEANVIAQFDPQTVGTPTHIFDVNLINKLKSHGAPNIGFDGNDPFVRNLLEDKLWREQKNRYGDLLRAELEEVLEIIVKDIDYDPPVPPDDRGMTSPARMGRSSELSPRQSLENFLRFCVDKYPAKHYILFILGHGVVVGNDVFLFDEHVSDLSNTLTLVELREVLAGFTQEVKHQKSSFELVGFHSCSVSSLEIAYELKGTANYMLASQGPAFVGSWPYRQILVSLFNDLIRCGKRVNVEELLGKIFSYCFYNSLDFLLAGYSFDLCLCNLNEVARIKRPLRELSQLLAHKGLTHPLVRNLILLAHWKAQSFWQESYTDLYDFCFSLDRLCRENLCLNEVKDLLIEIQEACRKVICELVEVDTRAANPEAADREPSREGEDERTKKIIVRAAFAGPAYQYSHGLSVYFPWTRPVADTQILREYKGYKFTETCWLDFLEEYFKTTLRQTRKEETEEEEQLKAARLSNPEEDPYKIYQKVCQAQEEEKKKKAESCKPQEGNVDDEPGDEFDEQDSKPTDPHERFQELLEDIASLVYVGEGELSSAHALSGGGPKTDPRDPTGDECTCSSIKNYPHDTRRRVKRGTKAAGRRRAIPISPDCFKMMDN